MSRLIVEEDEAGVRRFGQAEHRRIGPFHVLRLYGGPYDMARQHGALLREAIPRGPLPLFERYLGLFLRNSPLGPAAGTVEKLLDAWMRPRMLKRMPATMRAVAAGLADGAGLAEASVLRAYLMPDAVVYAMTLFGKLTRAPFDMPPGSRPAGPLVGGCPPLGCTSAIAGPERTERGALLHARNMDFPGVDRWDREPVVAFHHPEEGQTYVTFTSAGIAGGAITGMNASGLTFAVHQHFAAEFDLDGEPVGLAGEQVLREARTLDQAIGILDKHRPMAGWTYVLADAQRAIAYEIAPGLRRIVPMTDGLLGYANVYQHPDLVDAERRVYPAYVQANHARHHRVWAALRAGGAHHTEATMAAILADAQVDGVPAPVAVGDAICTPYTVLSVVMRPSDKRFWIGEGPVPTAAGTYLGFDLRAEGPAGKPKTVSSGETRETPRVMATLRYAEGWRAYLEDADLPKARAMLEQAAGLYPADSTLHHAAGLLALKAVDLTAAELHFRDALAQPHRAERHARSHAALAFTLTLAGRREEAAASIREARRLAPGDDIVKKQLSGRFTAGRARRLAVELLYADVVV